MYGGMSAQLSEYRTKIARDDHKLAPTMCLIGEPDVLYSYVRAVLPPLPKLVYVAADKNFTSRPGCAALQSRMPHPRRSRVHEEPDHENLCSGTERATGWQRTCTVVHPSAAGIELRHDVMEMLIRNRRRAASNATSGVDAAAAASEPPPPVAVLITRNRTSLRGRAFDANEEAVLASRLSKASGGLPVVLYTGASNLDDTIDLFGRAAVIVGIHGAGLTNSLFSIGASPLAGPQGITSASLPPKVCVVELSSWTDKAHKSHWRTSSTYHGRTDSSVPRWSPLIDWRIHRLPPEQIVASLTPAQQKRFWSDAPDPTMLNERKEPVKPARKRVIMLLDAPIFRMKEADIRGILGHVAACRGEDSVELHAKLR